MATSGCSECQCACVAANLPTPHVGTVGYGFEQAHLKQTSTTGRGSRSGLVAHGPKTGRV
jgi:hypothetical protein